MQDHTLGDATTPLRIALLAYRGKPHVGGQGVYVRQLAKAMVDLGHTVEVFGGQPYPELPDEVPLTQLPSLDIYNEHFPARTPGFWEIKNWKDLAEVLSFSSGQFPEPLAFSLRAWDALRRRRTDFDIVHDNQTLGYGLLLIERMGLPVLATIHHPITVDRRLEVEHAPNRRKRWSLNRWYSFTHMQTIVAKRLGRIVTVSENSYKDIVADHEVDPARMAIVPVGVDPDVFKPLEGVSRIPGRIVTTASADVTMKGLRYLLEALAKLRTEREDVHLVVIGKEKPGGASSQTIDRLGLRGHVEFVTGVPERRIIELYSEAEVAVVPSLYEGFSLPAIEALSCGCPLVATTGGAIPEVVGNDGETALLTEPGDGDALAGRIRWALDHPDEAQRIGLAGRKRVQDNWSWRHTAERTIEQYRMRLGQLPPDRGGRRLMLTVDYRRLGLQPGELVLDLGSGPGRHAFETMRRGARVVLCDYDTGELAQARTLSAAMVDAGELGTLDVMATTQGDGVYLPFPDDTFDRIIAAEVLEHIPDDVGAIAELHRVLKPGGTIAVTIPSWFPEKVCWALSDEYHAPHVAGGHVRIYTENEMRRKLRDTGLQPGDAHRAHALHSPYWWLRCAIDPQNSDDHPLVKAYLKLLTWDITDAPTVTRLADRVLNPVLGKSLIIYARKPAAATAHTTVEPAEVASVTTAAVPEVPGLLTADEVRQTAAAIAEWQLPNGMIPWFPGGHADAWNHVEAAMALDIGGYRAEAERAYDWLMGLQRPDGAWHQYYTADGVEQDKLDANVCAYIACGVWHHFLRHKDIGFLETLWPTIEAAIDFVLDLQTPRGEILWARHADGSPWTFALLTGSSSICHSLRAAIAIAHEVGHDRPDWVASAASLAHVVANVPEAFAPKQRWAMDWYYPVLAGVVTGARAEAHLDERYETFAKDGKGIRCVSDRPWITTAETCECALAYLAVGRVDRARELLAIANTQRLDDGRYWTGIVYPQEVHFPADETSTYSAAAVLLAADALGATSGSAALFVDHDAVLPVLPEPEPARD